MNMVERYLGAMAWQLPRCAREDIVTELRDDILTRIEAIEAQSGRSRGEWRRASTRPVLSWWGSWFWPTCSKAGARRVD